MEEYMGTILQFAFNFSPRQWMVCHGQVLAINTNQALFALLGINYGGNGITTFNIPDLRKKDKDGNYYQPGQIMEDGTPYIDSYICVEGIFPPRS